jgi:hypothetical protein
MTVIGRALGVGLFALVSTASCGTAGSGGTTAPNPAGAWDGGVNALAQEVILSTSGNHEIKLDPTQVGGFSWQYAAESPNPSPAGYTSGSGVGFLTCDLSADCTGASVEISDFRVWLQGSKGWVLAQAGAMAGNIESESLDGSTAMSPTIQNLDDAGTVQQVQVPNRKTYSFYIQTRFDDPAGFNGNFVVAITAQVVGGGTAARYGLMTGINWYQDTGGGAAFMGGGLGRYVLLSSTPTIAGYTNVDAEMLLKDPPAQQ